MHRIYSSSVQNFCFEFRKPWDEIPAHSPTTIILRFLCFLSLPSARIRYLKLGHDHFLQRSFTYIIRSSSCNTTLYRMKYLEAIKETVSSWVYCSLFSSAPHASPFARRLTLLMLAAFYWVMYLQLHCVLESWMRFISPSIPIHLPCECIAK